MEAIDLMKPRPTRRPRLAQETSSSIEEVDRSRDHLQGMKVLAASIARYLAEASGLRQVDEIVRHYVAREAARLGAVQSVAVHATQEGPAIAVVLLLAPTHDDAIVEAAARCGLSLREQDVAVRVARAERNADIARELGISEHTVRHHVERILSKLGVSSRHDVRRRLAKVATSGRHGR